MDCTSRYRYQSLFSPVFAARYLYAWEGRTQVGEDVVRFVHTHLSIPSSAVGCGLMGMGFSHIPGKA